MKFAEEYRVKNVKKEDSVGFDLCVLASSDHTVITYGSFGLWGAILSPGDVIAAKGTNNQTYSVVTICKIISLATFMLSLCMMLKIAAQYFYNVYFYILILARLLVHESQT